MKRGAVVSDCTPGTVCRQTRYATEPTTATSRTTTMSTQAFARDRLGTKRMIPCRPVANLGGDRAYEPAGGDRVAVAVRRGRPRRDRRGISRLALAARGPQRAAGRARGRGPVRLRRGADAPAGAVRPRLCGVRRRVRRALAPVGCLRCSPGARSIRPARRAALSRRRLGPDVRAARLTSTITLHDAAGTPPSSAERSRAAGLL